MDFDQLCGAWKRRDLIRELLFKDDQRLEDVDRIVPPSTTVATATRYSERYGISRVGEISGLERFQIPVAFAVRPNAKTLSVSQGKGIDRSAARASAIMEAIETAVAEERPVSMIEASYDDLLGSSKHSILQITNMSRCVPAKFDPTEKIHWCRGLDITSQAEFLVPWGLVGMDHTLSHPHRHDCFEHSSDGLASGNCLSEAVFHGLCELVERDATALFHMVPDLEKKNVIVDLRSFRSQLVDQLETKILAADFKIILLDMTSDIEVPSYMALIASRSFLQDPAASSWSQTAAGFGCHTSSERAAVRAITEAVQSRLTSVAGARDDLDNKNYTTIGCNRSPIVESKLPELMKCQPKIEAKASIDLRTQSRIKWLVDKLTEKSVPSVVVIPLTEKESEFQVVRVLAPGLEVGLEGSNTQLLKRGLLQFLRNAA